MKTRGQSSKNRTSLAGSKPVFANSAPISIPVATMLAIKEADTLRVIIWQI